MRYLLLVFGLLCLFSCNEPEYADLIILNGNVFTLNPDQKNASAIAIKDGRILDVGNSDDISEYKGKQTEIIDAENNFVMPGLIEGHGHFAGLGRMLLNPNLLETKNWQEVLQIVKTSLDDYENGEWIIGRGWHQEKWDQLPEQTSQGYPLNHNLSDFTGSNPVILEHASGHGIMANKLAMKLAGIQKETSEPKGGHIVRDDLGNPTGVFEEKAEDLIRQAYERYIENLSEDDKYRLWSKMMEKSERACLENGITSFHDAGNLNNDLTGTMLKHLEYYKRYAGEGQLDVRMYMMIRDSNHLVKEKIHQYPLIGEYDHFLTIRAVKKQIDGALGSYGAWLLEPYNDREGFYGHNTHPLDELKEIAAICDQNNMQMAVHAIGDRGNREVLDIYEKYCGKDISKDMRWRIEHAQHLHPDDIPRFGEMGVIPSIQAIHCTSDAPFVEKRLGPARAASGAYAWRALIDSGSKLANGTDTPVENINPFHSLYASVTRKRADNGLIFYPAQSMTRMEALYSYTLGNAFAAFEEDLKGSIEKGKLADIVILDTDLVQCLDEEILNSKVLYTLVGGVVKYKIK